ncbi:MAG: IreB family regulatory phosphoprotein [Oscillospiraceae bacterium]|nr:IreB family regulatory phosphoprotein [Oscillospiraceae bacterium]
MATEFENIMEHIVASIRSAGYEPYDQLYGYLKTGDETYITRTGDARNLIKTLDRNRLQEFVDTLCIKR